MIGIISDRIILMSTKTMIEPSYNNLLRLCMDIDYRKKVVLYNIGSDDMIGDFIEYVMKIFPYSHNGGNSTVNVLRGVNGKYYHVTVTNNHGGKLIIREMSNIVPTSLDDIMVKFPAKTIEESCLKCAKVIKDMDLNGNTIGAMSLANFRNDFGYAKYFDKFPKLDKTLVSEMHSAYMGGFMMALPGEYHHVVDYDCNSLYPYMLANYPTPYGKPIPYDGPYIDDDSYPAHIDVMIFRADLKPDGFPFLTYNQHSWLDDSSRLISTHGYVTMALTDVDQKLLRENYDVSVYKNVKGWKFRQSQGFFYEWVNSWGKVKETSVGGVRYIVKLLMNSLVGKFGAYSRGKRLEPEVVDGVLTWNVVSDEETVVSSYPPVSMFVTAHARRYLINAMRSQKGGRVVYANTDGFMVAYGDGDVVSSLDVDDTELGKWKIEAEYDKVVIVRTGLYQGLKAHGGVDLISSGITRTTPIPWEDFHKGGMVVDDNGSKIML